MRRSQRNRVLAALYRRARHGITQIDFDLPDVIDGGTPIKRVAARVEELRNEGFQIDSGERRAKCVVYRLRAVEATARCESSDSEGPEEGTGRASRRGAEPHGAVASSPSAPEPTLFDEAA